MQKKIIFLTGATGHMGSEGLKQLLDRRDRFNIVVLVLPTKGDRERIAPYEGQDGVKVVYGDLTNYNDVLRCVTGADYVLHVGGMVSPMADYKIELTRKVNIGAVTNIVNAIKAQPDPDKVKLVYIGSVAMTGDRNAPIHWGRTGDPIKVSVYDNYAITKVAAERIVIESGLKYWVSLRQTGVLYPELLNSLDPIMFHEPLNGVFEWATAHDSGVLLANACEDDVPESFWQRIYNIGGGEKYRTVNWQFMRKAFATLGMNDFRRCMDAQWFATQNFHGQWFSDSDELESILHFRSGNVDTFLEEMRRKAPSSTKLARFVPSWIIKQFVFKPVVNKPFGPLYWKKHNIENRITSFFGSREQWDKLPSWKEYQLIEPSRTSTYLDHGYDETKPLDELGIEDMQQAATFRGGKCLSTTMKRGDLNTKLTWQCAFGHQFEASPRLVLLGGHFCPHCTPAPWNYDEEARRNPFFAQVWHPLHPKDEHHVYDETIFNDNQSINS